MQDPKEKRSRKFSLIGILIVVVTILLQTEIVLDWIINFFQGGIAGMGEITWLILGPLILFALIFASSIRIVREYERGVIFRLGRLKGAKGPGIFIVIPIIDQMVRVSLRVITLDIPPQEVITQDNVTAQVNAVVFFRVLDPEKSVVAVEDYFQATNQISQTTLRSVLGQVELDGILGERDQLNKKLQGIIDENTDPWGIKVQSVEIKDVRIPHDMQRAIGRQAEAERERRSKIINAEGEFEASKRLAEAAKILQEQPASIQLRFLQTLLDVTSEQSTTIVLPIPIELLRGLTKEEKTPNPLDQ